ncbi:autotransporter outer membrane beta-barrel domain-containing protein, partial [Hyphomicrobium sulfonivorans]|uniref:autotransporter outer membrane beta-barrel domain-containing protein n=1 Tax=Hyphomicrobium sulfonivorans TaxID=121290 RepID=UPI001AEBEFA1
MNSFAITTGGNDSYGLHAQDGGAITAESGSVNTAGDGAYGIYAITGGQITGDAITVHTSGVDAHGAYVEGSTALITLSNGTQITTAGTGHGLHARDSGQIAADSISIATSADEAAGAIAIDGGTINIENGSSVTTIGDRAWGAGAVSGGTVTIDGSNITTSGGEATGANATANATINILNGSSVTTSGAHATGAQLRAFSAMTVDNSSITTSGDGGWGIGVYLNSTATVVGSTIATSGTDAIGTQTQTNSTTTLDGSSVTTSGDGAWGAYVVDSATLNLSNGSSIATSGAGAHGVHLADTSQLVTANSTITAIGNGADVVRSASGNNTATITNSSLSAANGAGLNVQAGTLVATVTNSTVTGGDELLNVSSTGTLDLEAVGSTLTGSATTASGGTSTLILRDTRWNVTDDSNVSFVFNHAGSVVQFTPPSSSAGPFKTLTVNDYAGQGGTLGVNTYLGADGSPSDRLVIDGGNGVGTSLLSVNSVGGGGDLTTLDGILVVEAINSATVPGLFSLAAPVIAGPYQYSLYRGGEGGSNPDNWYLRSDLDCSLDPSASICGDDIPDWRQETSLYAAVPAMTLLYGRLMLDTLHERRGTAVSAYAEGAPNAAWARVIGQHGDRDGGKGGIYGAGPKYDYDFWAFQGGMDLYRDGDVGTSRNHAGAFFAIGHGSGDVQHIGDGKAGENSFMAYSWGAYWTHYTPENAYVDALLLGSWYDIDAKSNRIDKLTTNGGAFGASLEGGYPVYTGPGGFSI